ncbi:MAG: DUF3445 domain-containing protein [Ilumatobacteraceae bacterium]
MTHVPHQHPFTPYDESPVVDMSGFAPMPPVDDILPRAMYDEFRHRLGTRSLDLAQWLTPDAETAPTIEMKRMLIEHRRSDVVALFDGGETAAQEAAELVAQWTGNALTSSGIDALVDAALMVADDLTVLEPRSTSNGEELLFVAGVVCSPSRWKLADKMGKNMIQVHAPVSKYAEHIGAAVDTTLQRLSVERPLWRSNWTLEDHPALFQPALPVAPLVRDVSKLWIRIERETLRRLPLSGGVLFTIRGFQQPLGDYVNRGSEHVEALRALIERLPEDLSRYKSVLPYRQPILGWLAGLS